MLIIFEMDSRFRNGCSAQLCDAVIWLCFIWVFFHSVPLLPPVSIQIVPHQVQPVTEGTLAYYRLYWALNKIVEGMPLKWLNWWVDWKRMEGEGVFEVGGWCGVHSWIYLMACFMNSSDSFVFFSVLFLRLIGFERLRR